MSLLLCLQIGAALLCVLLFVQQRGLRVRELGRFQGQGGQASPSLVETQLAELAASLDPGSPEELLRNRGASKARKELVQNLAAAGFETAAERGKFVLLRTLCYLGFPALGACAYLYVIPYYATIITIFSAAVGIMIPLFWLQACKRRRLEQVQRELPLVLDLTNLGTSAGWDLAASLERVVDALYVEYPQHPLIKELKKARWLTASGYTWNEALERVSERLGDESVVRTMLALGQAMTQGGNRSKQLESIAEDTQRLYYAQLDRRLASLPIKVVLLTMLLMIAYFIILLAPATVQMGHILPGGGKSTSTSAPRAVAPASAPAQGGTR